MEKWPVFNQNHGLSPLEKSQFFDLLNFFFFIVHEYRTTPLPGLYFLKTKYGKMAIFEPKPWVINPFEKISIFRLFEFPFL